MTQELQIEQGLGFPTWDYSKPEGSLKQPDSEFFPDLGHKLSYNQFCVPCFMHTLCSGFFFPYSGFQKRIACNSPQCDSVSCF